MDHCKENHAHDADRYAREILEYAEMSSNVLGVIIVFGVICAFAIGAEILRIKRMMEETRK